MKSFWTWFLCGASLLVVVFALRRPMAMAESDARLKTVEDTNMSLMKKDAPGSEDLEKGLAKREQEIKKREEELKAWEIRLGVQEANIKTELEDLRTLQEKNAAAIEADKERREKINQDLVKTYETMSPKKAAQVLSVMDINLAADFLMMMKSKKVAAILDSMDSDKAAELSSKIAGRRKPASPASSGTQARGN